MILLNFEKNISDVGTSITVNSSVDLRERELAISVTLANGVVTFADWTISFIEYNPISVKVESVIVTKDRTLIKIPDVIGTTFIFNGETFHSVGMSNGYTIVNKKLSRLSTGDLIEILSPCYKYEILIKGIEIDQIREAILTVGHSDITIKRSLIH